MDPATVAILVALVGGPIGGTVAARYLRPKQTLPERLESMEKRQEQVENDQRLLQDYCHQLRQHIANGNPPPPPPWPEGLTQ